MDKQMSDLDKRISPRICRYFFTSNNIAYFFQGQVDYEIVALHGSKAKILAIRVHACAGLPELESGQTSGLLFSTSCVRSPPSPFVCRDGISLPPFWVMTRLSTASLAGYGGRIARRLETLSRA